MESLLPAKSAPQISPATANWHEGEHNAGETEDTNKESVNKQIINTRVSTKPNSQYQTNADTNRHKQTDTLYLHFWTTRKGSKRKVCERAEKRWEHWLMRREG